MRSYPSVNVGSAIAALLALGCSDRQPVAPRAIAAPTPRFETQAQTQIQRSARHIVTLLGPATRDFEQEVDARGGRVERRHPEIQVVTVTGLSPAAAAALAARADVADVTEDVALRWIPPVDQLVRRLAGRASPGAGAQGTDQSGAFFFKDFQWNMRVTEADQAWGVTPAGRNALVCILDTGVDPVHLDLLGKVDLSQSTSFVSSEPFIEDLNFHGTFVSAIVTSNGLGVASVAPDARLCAVKVLDQTGTGSFGDVIAGILFAASEGANVINMSFGAYVDRRAPGVRSLIRALQAALDYARSQHVLLVAAAGNAGINLDTDPPQFLQVPAELHGVISVGATGPINQQNFDRLASYSNFGGRRGITLVAPGGDFVPPNGVLADLIISACSEFEVALLPLGIDCTGGNFYLFGAGTSFASPMVAGEGAVVRSLGEDEEGVRLGEEDGGAAASCVKRGVDVVGPRAIFGRGRMNVLKAAGCAQARADVAVGEGR